MIYRSLFLAFLRGRWEIATNRFIDRLTHLNVKLQSNLAWARTLVPGFPICWHPTQQNLSITMKLLFCWWCRREFGWGVFSYNSVLRFSTGLGIPEELTFQWSASSLSMKSFATVATKAWMSKFRQLPCIAQESGSSSESLKGLR